MGSEFTKILEQHEKAERSSGRSGWAIAHAQKAHQHRAALIEIVREMRPYVEAATALPGRAGNAARVLKKRLEE